MSESEISQTHEGPVTEAGGDSQPAEPSPQPRPSARPQIGDTRPAPPAAAAAPAARVVPAVATLPKVAPRPVTPVTRPGAFEDSDDVAEDEVGDDDEGRGDGKRTRSRRRSGRDRKSKQVGRYLVCVHVQPAMTQIAMLEGRSLVEHYVSRAADDTNQIDGNVYRGRVQNVLPGMEAAFVDIGIPKNAVLYRG